MSNLKDDLKLLNDVFDSRWAADMRAIRKWQEATGQQLVWPDHADLCTWLLRRLAHAETVIDAGRVLGSVTLPADTPFDDYHAAGLNLALHIRGYDEAWGLTAPPAEGAGEGET